MTGILDLPEELLGDILSLAAYDTKEFVPKSSEGKVCFNKYKGVIQACSKFRRIGGSIYFNELHL